MSLSAKVDVKINPNLNTILMQGVNNGLYKACNIVHADAIKKAPIHLGEFRNSISQEVDENKHEGYIFTNVEYAPYIEFGTRPHFPPVSALKKWASDKLGDENLAFAVAKSISKKGIKEKPVFRPALYDNQSKIVSVINEEVAKKIK